ncbi:MAG: DEAD/DEAH box helicase [Anaerolineae bacterium]|jgi:ATP-dependent Lhr-like helicase
MMPLDGFLPATRQWFLDTYGAPTAAQAQGWPAIRRGEHTLILSPTGSGKTLAAFLWGIDRIFAQLASNPEQRGVLLLYVSPLKALNNDVDRNLQVPLRGIRHMARAMGSPLPELLTAVRTGDTPQATRQRMLHTPPHILITTPESLYLLLTSPVARELLAPVQSVIVDEIHTLCGNKRGVHLALSLERLEALTGHSVQRIGLSATQRPLEAVAHYLGGQRWQIDPSGERSLVPRPVTVVDAGVLKPMDLRVITPVADLRRLPGGSVWPALIPQVLDEIRRHDTTLIFANSRRSAERAADRLNEQYAIDQEEETPPGSTEALLADGVPKGGGWAGTGRVGGPFRAHHGSVSRELRLELENGLKQGSLAALIATSSLELGIDIGSVDAVLQLQSPRGIARGLQRVGRAGHLVGQTSVGRIYVTHREDLIDAAAVAHGMLAGDIEPTHTPQNCLDILAQQIVAMVSVEPQGAEGVFDLVRQASGYQGLTHDAFEAVLRMISGGYSSEAYSGLRPAIEWDRVNGQLRPLPGSRLLAIRNGGTIPDRGEFRVLLADGRTSLGTLDEEFVFETHPGDVFALGTNTWRVMNIDQDVITVAQAEGSFPRMPFWRGELPKREYHMGQRLGAFRRLLAERVVALEGVPESPDGDWPPAAGPVLQWLQREYALDDASARNAICYVHQQLEHSGAISSDRTVVVEQFADALGDERLVIHSCFGARINSVWAIALTHAFRERLGATVDVQVNDDGMLFRLVEADRRPPLDLIDGMSGAEARERVLQELPNSALFGAQFRMNAGRALVLPRVRGAGRRTPFWLQRLRARDLLAIAREWPDFPLIAETYRDCMRDVLDVDHCCEMLDQIAAGTIRVVHVHTLVPSPIAAALLLEFASVHLYEGDTPRLERQIQALSLNRELLADLLDDGTLAELLRPDVVERVERELQHLAEGYQARSPDELAVILRELGDLDDGEVDARCLGPGDRWIADLAGQGRVHRVCCGAGERWVTDEQLARYRQAFSTTDLSPSTEEGQAIRTSQLGILRQMLRVHGPITVEGIARRYGWHSHWVQAALAELLERGLVLSGRLTGSAPAVQWCDRQVLERLHRETLAALRREIQPVPMSGLAGFLARWQQVAPFHDRDADPVPGVIERLAGLQLPAEVWERDVLPARVPGYSPALLDALCSRGEVIWQAEGPDRQHMRLRLFPAGEGSRYLPDEPEPAVLERLGDMARRTFTFLVREGPLEAGDLAEGLRLSQALCERALLELVLAGLVTADSLQAVRNILEGGFASGQGEGMQSSLDASLADWKSQRLPPAGRSPFGLRRPGRAEMRAGRRRLERGRGAPQTGGRWSSLYRYAVLGPALSPEERALLQARQLLYSQGLISRELVQQQRGMLSWAALYPPLYRMELTGEVRRGFLVQGLSGLQYALPEAVEELRAWSKTDGAFRARPVVLNALDPALLYGADPAPNEAEETGSQGSDDLALPGLTRVPSNYVVQSDGVPVLTYEHASGRWHALAGTSPELLSASVTALLAHLTRPGGIASRPRRVMVHSWNDASPLGTPVADLLSLLGFRRETPDMVWDGLVPAGEAH